MTTHEDTSMCDHLRTLMGMGAPPPQVKTEPVDPSDPPNGGESSQPNGSLTRSEQRVALERRYESVIRWGARAQGVKRRKTTPASCTSCATTLTRPWACLGCEFTGCMPVHASTSRQKECFRSHPAGSSNAACSFAADVTTGAVFCATCNDVTYPDTFETLAHLARLRVEEANDQSRETGAAGGSGRRRGAWKGWDSSVKQSDGYLQTSPAPCRGLRPLLNLSQTCFLSAILQCLIHNPLLKAYFLSEKHNRHICSNNGTSPAPVPAGPNANTAPPPKGLNVGKPFLGTEANGVEAKEREKGCMCCEMDRAFEQFHNDDKTPFGPVTMLYAMWHASAELEGYGQQDAHSFFLAALDQIHSHARGQMSSCNCIAHQTFSGSLLSTVTCSSCAHASSTVDPIMSLQLDFAPSDVQATNGSVTGVHSSAASVVSSSSSANGDAMGSGNGPDPILGQQQVEGITLGSMLRRFCANETVGEQGKGWGCEGCGGGKDVTATRTLSIKKLPPVLSFQLKRFAHSATSTKVEAPVRFPSKLFMRPYVDRASAAASFPEPLPDSMFEYELFAVVTHEGKLDNGHYWADVRSGDEWWHCDDDKVTPTTLSAVLAQKAYMLFYIKRSLSFVHVHRKHV